LLVSADGILPGGRDTVLRRFDLETLSGLISAVGLDVALLQGDGVVSDSMVSGAGSGTREDELTEFEQLAATSSPLRDIASRLHALGRRPA
jgi:hypothetical protein